MKSLFGFFAFLLVACNGNRHGNVSPTGHDIKITPDKTDFTFEVNILVTKGNK